MTDYRVLYYPNFTPDPTWLRRILLLADGVVRIVPSDVDPDDPDAVVRLSEEVPGCLATEVPTAADIAVDHGDTERLARVFELLGREARQATSSIQINISGGGNISIGGHVFLHDSKLSDFVRSQLRHNGLILEKAAGLAPQDFLVVREEASNVILSGVAARIAARTGMDTITEKPLPFAFGALKGVPRRSDVGGAAEGALLSAIAEVAIPAEVASMKPHHYLELRDSYGGIRQAFKALTSEWSNLHRLTKFTDPAELDARVKAIALDFDTRCREYRASQFSRTFKAWTPLCVGGVLTVASAVASPSLAPGIAVGSVVVSVIERLLNARDDAPEERVFKMLSGVRRQIITDSGIREVL